MFVLGWSVAVVWNQSMCDLRFGNILAKDVVTWHTWNSHDATNNKINGYMRDDEETRTFLGNTHEKQNKISRALISTCQLLQLIVFPLYFCVYILLHHVAYTANNHKTSRVYLLNLIYSAVISFFYGKLSKESLYAGLLTADCPET